MSATFFHAEQLCERTVRRRAREETLVTDDRQCDARMLTDRLRRSIKPSKPRSATR